MFFTKLSFTKNKEGYMKICTVKKLLKNKVSTFHEFLIANRRIVYLRHLCNAGVLKIFEVVASLRKIVLFISSQSYIILIYSILLYTI